MEIRGEFQGFFSVSDILPPVTAHEYRGYIIGAWARPEVANGYTSVGIVYERRKLKSIIQVERIEGELFESEELAERHGLELCKNWIDKQTPELAANVKQKSDIQYFVQERADSTQCLTSRKT